MAASDDDVNQVQVAFLVLGSSSLTVSLTVRFSLFFSSDHHHQEAYMCTDIYTSTGQLRVVDRP